jgi:hypothetical protein
MALVVPWVEYDLSATTAAPLYFYVGAGLSQAAGVVGWRKLVITIHRYRVQHEGWTGPPPASDDASANSRYLDDFISERDQDGAQILSAESKDLRAFGRTVLLNILLRHSSDFRTAVPDERLSLQRLLWLCHPHGVFTSNYDTLIERVCPQEMASALRIYRYSAAFLPYILSNPTFVLKLHGDVNDLGSMLLNPESAWSAAGALNGRRGEWLRQLWVTVNELGNIVFLGAGLRDRTVRELDSAASVGVASHERLALVPAKEVACGTELGKLISSGKFTSMTFLTFNGNAEEACGRFLDALAAARVAGCVRPRCAEATDIWLNIFASPPFPQKRRWKTSPWTLQSFDQSDHG